MKLQYLIAFGSIVILGLGAIAGTTASNQHRTSGKALFENCLACHTVLRAEPKKKGPYLFGIADSVAGTREHVYSDGFRAAVKNVFVWDKGNLSAYLKDPRAFLAEKAGKPVSGGCPNFVVPDAKDRAKLITYLQALKLRSSEKPNPAWGSRDQNAGKRPVGQ